MAVPKLKLNSGYEIPQLGLGTWQSLSGEVTQAVKDAIDIGYRHIDGAFVYGNEKELGAGLKAKLAEGVIKREDIFITSKLWNTFHSPGLVESACKQSLTGLGLTYLDLYLIHWPVGYQEGGELFPIDPNGKAIESKVDYVDTWKAMEDLVAKGYCKSIGVSNFNKKQIERILAAAKIKPTMNQIECHAHLTQVKLSEFCKSKGILVTAYSPLGAPHRPWVQPDDPVLMNDEKLKELAQKYKKSTAQILIRYQLDRGHVVIPKSVTKSRIQENFNVLDFQLSADDVKLINSFDCNGRICPLSTAIESPDHPFKDEY